MKLYTNSIEKLKGLLIQAYQEELRILESQIQNNLVKIQTEEIKQKGDKLNFLKEVMQHCIELESENKFNINQIYTTIYKRNSEKLFNCRVNNIYEYITVPFLLSEKPVTTYYKILRLYYEVVVSESDIDRSEHDTCLITLNLIKIKYVKYSELDREYKGIIDEIKIDYSCLIHRFEELAYLYFNETNLIDVRERQITIVDNQVELEGDKKRFYIEDLDNE